MSYGYDELGRLMSVTDAANNITRYTYDALNRLETVTNTDGTSTYGYDEVGNRTSLSYPNGSSQTWNYDTRNRLTSTKIYNANGAVIQSFDYTLHPTGRRTKITELDGRTSDYTYNDRYWLTTETITDAINGNYSASYTYDNVGNRVQGIEAGVTTQYQYDANDRISQQGGVSYSYDANGNTLAENDQGSITRYRWNSQNEMVEHEAGGFTTDYQYNAEGIRYSQSDGITDRTYLVDANRSYAQVLTESVNGSLDVTYHYGDDLISQTRDDQTHHFHVDGLGSTRVLTDASGNRTDSYGYAAFGEVLAQDGVTDNDYLYTGEQFDENLDQYYLWARYYDQWIGRFSRMDDWMGESGSPTTLNKYLYANSDAANLIDPTGQFAIGFGGLGAATSIRGTLSAIGVSGVSRLAINRTIGATIKLGRTVASSFARSYLKKCIKKQDKCRLGLNLLIVGFDAPSIIKHIDSAQSYLPRTYRLTWDFKNKGKRHKRWYVKRGNHLGGCGIEPKPQSDANCDEYPMQSTLQGGERNYNLGRVSLKWVNGAENQYVGGHFGGMTGAMKKSKNYNFWVITTTSFPTVGLPLAKASNK